MPKKNRFWTDSAIGPIGKFQLRIRSEEPTLIENSEVIDTTPGTVDEDVMARMRTMIGRTSYMGYGVPNREVMWAIDQWDYGWERWECIANGRSRLGKGKVPQ